jgi:hypothetical protein
LTIGTLFRQRKNHAGNNRWFSSSGGDVRVFSSFILILKREKTMEKYNGWTNYATWRVNLEIFDGMTAGDFYSFSVYTSDCAHELGDDLKNYATEILELEGTSGLTFDYAMAFLSAVNWREIAQHMIDDYILETSTGE